MKKVRLSLILLVALLCSGCVKDLEFLTLSVECYPSDAGTIVGTGSYLKGTITTLEAIPAEGYVFQGWTEWIDGFLVDYKDNPMMVVMNRSHHFYAHFEEASTSGGGTSGGSTSDAKNRGSLQFGYDWWDTVYVSMGTQDGAVWYSNAVLSMNLAESKNSSYPNISLRFQMNRTGSFTFYYIAGINLGYKSKNPGATGWEGVWSMQSAKIQVDELDLTNHRLSMSVNAIMYDAYQCNVEDVNPEECDAKILKINLRCPVYYSSLDGELSSRYANLSLSDYKTLPTPTNSNDGDGYLGYLGVQNVRQIVVTSLQDGGNGNVRLNPNNVATHGKDNEDEFSFRSSEYGWENSTDMPLYDNYTVGRTAHTYCSRIRSDVMVSCTRSNIGWILEFNEPVCITWLQSNAQYNLLRYSTTPLH